MTNELPGGDDIIETYADVWDGLFPGVGIGDVLRDAWRDVKTWLLPPLCDCPMDPYHRWNCAPTPIWAQTIRDLDVNPWTVVRNAEMSFPELWRLADYCALGPCSKPGGHEGSCWI